MKISLKTPSTERMAVLTGFALPSLIFGRVNMDVPLVAAVRRGTPYGPSHR